MIKCVNKKTRHSVESEDMFIWREIKVKGLEKWLKKERRAMGLLEMTLGGNIQFLGSPPFPVWLAVIFLILFHVLRKSPKVIILAPYLAS